MTLLETAYRQLRDVGLVRNAEAFSSDYLLKNKNWYAYQKHKGRDYSVGVAIQCLRSLRTQQRNSAYNDQQQAMLRTLERDLLALLQAAHGVADVC